MNCKLALILTTLFFLCIVAAAAPINDSYNITGAFPQSAEPYRIILFVPSPNMIHSDQVLDQINTPEGGVLFGTSFGLSLYNGTWSTRHINHDNISQGLMDDYITAVEYDPDGNLWIGYSGGIQIYNGIYYQTLRDQQLFKDPRIQDLQRWHDDMWVATGQSGIHRFRNGVWTWFQPMSKRGPGFYEIWSMTLDPASDTLVIATTDNGIWIVRSPDDPVIFEQIAQKDGSYHDLKNVRRDPLGGVYFFNDTTVIHYSNTAGFTSVLTVSDLSFTGISINDLTASPEGKLFVATDDGIYIWSNNQVYRHLGRFEGIGTSEAVRTVTIDRQNRVWFSSAGYVGYYLEQPGSQTTISIELVTPTTEPPLTPLEDQSNISVTHEVSPQQNAEPVVVSQQEGLSPILDPIFKAINSVLVKIGLKQDSP